MEWAAAERDQSISLPAPSHTSTPAEKSDLVPKPIPQDGNLSGSPIDAMFESTEILHANDDHAPTAMKFPPIDSQDYNEDNASDCDVFNMSQDVGAELEFKDQLVSAPKTTKFSAVNYARTAKRVDVKRFKEDIWGALAEEVNQN